MTTAMLIASPRRVLAHKDNNTPVRQQSSLDNDLLKSPSRDVTTASRRDVPAFHIPSKTGEKRKRTGVSMLDEAESRVGSKTAKLESQDAVARASLRHEPLSQLSLLGEDADLVDGELPNLTTSTSNLNSSSLEAPPASTLPTSSQSIQDVVVIEEQFQLPEEMSQNSLEKIHAIKIFHSQQHTSQLVPPTRPTLLAEASQESFGMSAFIEYEKDGSDEVEGDVKMKDAEAQDDDMTMIQLPSSDIEPAMRDVDASNTAPDMPSLSQSPKLAQVCAHLLFSLLVLTIPLGCREPPHSLATRDVQDRIEPNTHPVLTTSPPRFTLQITRPTVHLQSSICSTIRTYIAIVLRDTTNLHSDQQSRVEDRRHASAHE